MLDQVLAYKTVMDLVSHLSMSGYQAYTDNYYISPKLFTDLKLARFQAIGTIRKDRKGLGREFQFAKLTKGKK